MPISSEAWEQAYSELEQAHAELSLQYAALVDRLGAWYELGRMTVPGEPQAKQRARTGKGRTYTPKATRDAEEKIGWAWRSSTSVRAADVDQLRVVCTFHLGTRRARDVDNLAKLVLDGLNTVAYADDRQVIELVARRVMGSDRPRTEVSISRAVSDNVSDNW